jgi:hypothetical protein
MSLDIEGFGRNYRCQKVLGDLVRICDVGFPDGVWGTKTGLDDRREDDWRTNQEQEQENDTENGVQEGFQLGGTRSSSEAYQLGYL